MSSESPSPATLVFGPFEVNAQPGELRKRGVRVRLSGQPFEVLLVLLARPSDLVTREQLRDRLWSDGTFVDFEHGLNAAINKLRRALDDSADHRQYIETVPGRDYRFNGTIEPASNGGRPGQQVHEAPRSLPAVAPTDGVRRLASWRWLTIAAGVVVAGLLVAM
jgi:DNA-binding winged helix-turn-helix (wHTH) protein